MLFVIFSLIVGLAREVTAEKPRGRQSHPHPLSIKPSERKQLTNNEIFRQFFRECLSQQRATSEH